MLMSNGFNSLEMILKIPPSELAIFLGIDLYVARMIYFAAERHMHIEHLQQEINEEELVYYAAKREK